MLYRIIALICVGALCGCDKPSASVSPPATVSAANVVTVEDVTTRQVGVHIGNQVPFYYEGMDDKMQDASCTVEEYKRNHYPHTQPGVDVIVTLHCKVRKP